MSAAPAQHPTRPPRRFPTDLTDAQWRLLAPLLPTPRSGPGRPGRPATSRRALVDGIPFAFTTFPGEIWRTPRSWVEASYPNVTYFHEVDKGGHFAAWEEPQLFAEELRAAFRSLRQ